MKSGPGVCELPSGRGSKGGRAMRAFAHTMRVTLGPDQVIRRLRDAVQEPLSLDSLTFLFGKPFVGFVGGSAFAVRRNRLRRGPASDHLVGRVVRTRSGSRIEYEVRRGGFAPGDEAVLSRFLKGLFEDCRALDCARA